MNYPNLLSLKLRQSFSIIILSATLLGCGYFENDGIVFEKEIMKNFQLTRQSNSDQTNLVYLKGERIASVVVVDCKTVYFDSTNQVIFVAEYVNQYNTYFYQVGFDTSSLNGNHINYYKRSLLETNFVKKIQDSGLCFTKDSSTPTKIIAK